MSDLHQQLDETIGPDSEEKGLATFAELHAAVHLLADEIQRLRAEVSRLSARAEHPADGELDG